MSNNIIITLNKIVEDKIISSVRDEKDFQTRDMIIRTYISPETVSCNSFLQLDPNDNKLNLNMLNNSSEEHVKVDEVSLELHEHKPRKSEGKINFPTMIKCQNCETNFPTKYQYQRHQCDFNAEKVILKSSGDANDHDGMKVKYDCSICGKQFVSRTNLIRHQVGHENVNINICEHCNKQFVSENRLRIHKENHCKKAGDISKFYRSDVTVWKCKKCHEVFSSAEIGNYHVNFCTEIVSYDNEYLPGEINAAVAAYYENGEEHSGMQERHPESKHIEKVLTEMLLQCEFCNRTYADKNLLLMHQRKHTTERNYECIDCNEYFDSFAVASTHWLRKCSEYANLFYLPKLTYCEYCDRTFKSHEILYNHKIKKKHYTPKLHLGNVSQQLKYENKTKPNESKEVINKLIEDVLKTLDVPMSKNQYMDEFKVNNSEVIKTDEITELNKNSENHQNNMEMELVTIKTEPDSCETSSSANQTNSSCEPMPQKSKRGRKRKWSKQSSRNKRCCTATDEGFRYQCERCIKVFNTITLLEMHRESEHAASFTCDECPQTLHSAKALLIHSRAHKSLKPYVCDTCGRSYSQTSHLWQHMRFHQGIKPFACPHEGCEARYTIRPDLKDHIRKVHTRERPFKCNVCNKCFLTGSVYYQHRLIHTNDRRYGCDVCQKRFFRADALNNHKRIHTDERPYPCSICGREFRQKGDRNKHLRTQHPSTVIINGGLL